MNILVDGPARSGKLLLGKLLLGSSQLKFQHFSGDVETLLESIYFNRANNEVRPILIELIRNNLVHTIEDLRQFRQLSINPSDSSWYKNSSFFNDFSEEILSGNIGGLMGDNPQFVFHSHECVLFLEMISDDRDLVRYFSLYLRTMVSIIRNPASQALSWMSRDYPKAWSLSNSHASPSILYPSHYVLPSLLAADIQSVPWWINHSLDYYLNNGSLNYSCLESITIEDLLTLSVCYLNHLYLESFSNSYRVTDASSPLNRYYIYHEDIHDNRANCIELILNELHLNYNPNVFSALVDKETNPSRFGRKSIQPSFDKLAPFLASSSVLSILEACHADYLSRLNH